MNSSQSFVSRLLAFALRKVLLNLNCPAQEACRLHVIKAKGLVVQPGDSLPKAEETLDWQLLWSVCWLLTRAFHFSPLLLPSPAAFTHYLCSHTTARTLEFSVQGQTQLVTTAASRVLCLQRAQWGLRWSNSGLNGTHYVYKLALGSFLQIVHFSYCELWHFLSIGIRSFI